jgi:uncharacterized membrane-anchored protein YitT (DUF2179 family)
MATRKKLADYRIIIVDYLYILIGAFIQAIAMRVFLIPGLMVSGGISGAAQIIQFFTGWPIGVMVILGNLPLFALGWRYLSGTRFALRTAASVLLFSLFTDLLIFVIPQDGITHDIVLQALYGGVFLGAGLGLVYRGRGTSGGSDILGRILSHHHGVSISQAYLITDGLVVLASGFAFGWERALYGLIVIYVSGLTAELVSEGNSIVRTAFIVTNQPDAVINRIFTTLERGVTILPGTGAYTGLSRPMLYCVLTRSEINILKTIVHEADPAAFMVISQSNEALGEGFEPLKRD